MFGSILALALVSFAPADPPKQPERWIPYSANPAWEVYGTEDATGRFRYSAMRHKQAQPPVLNLGVNLPPVLAGAPPQIMGTDGEAAALVFRAAEGEELPDLADCDDGSCRRKRKEVEEEAEAFALGRWLKDEGNQALAIVLGLAGLAVTGLIVFIVLALLVKAALWAAKRKG